MNQTYRIVARGLKRGYSEEQAADLLAGLLKRSADQVKPLLGERHIVVKKRLSLADATKYQVALDRCGCVSEIETESASRKQDSAGPAPLSTEELERMNGYARQMLATLSEEFGAEAHYDMRGVEWLARNLNTKRHKYAGELGVKVANLYGAFLGNVLIESYPEAQPVWVKTREGIGIHFRKPGGRMLKVVFPIARVFKQIEHGEEYSILAFMRAQQQFPAEKPVPKVAPARRPAPSAGAAPPVTLHIDETADDRPLKIVFPHSICCNCGTNKEIHSITTALSKKRFDGSETTLTAELPFCVPCVLTADRVRPSLGRQAVVILAALAVYTLAVLRPLHGAATFGAYTGVWLLLIFAALCAGVIYLMHKVTPPQTSRYQPVALKTLKKNVAGVLGIGFSFTNPDYAAEFKRANVLEMEDGRIV